VLAAVVASHRSLARDAAELAVNVKIVVITATAPDQ